MMVANDLEYGCIVDCYSKKQKQDRYIENHSICIYLQEQWDFERFEQFDPNTNNCNYLERV